MRKQLKLIIAVASLAAAASIAAIRFGWFAEDDPPIAHAYDTSSGLDQAFNLTSLRVDRSLLMSGGPGKDGIPSLTTPKTVSLSEAQFLRDDDRVIIVQLGPSVKVYPLSILNWHEIVNDVIDGVPIAVVYCPLCDSATVVDRRLDDVILEFGVSGLLLHSNVLMYDRKDNALWSQVGFAAISGPYAGRALRYLPFTLATVRALRRDYPRSSVISIETGHSRDYSANPYAGYFTDPQLMFPVPLNDRRMEPKERIVGVRWQGKSRAYRVSELLSRTDRTLRDQWNTSEVVLAAMPDGSVGVVKLPDGAEVTHTFWFAWAAFHPKTNICVLAETGPQ